MARFSGRLADEQEAPKSRFGGTPVVEAPQPAEELRHEKLKKMARAALDFGGNKAGAEDLFGQQYTLGLQKPVGALAGALGGELASWFGGGGDPNATFGERYRAGTEAYDERTAEARKNSGWVGTGAELAGSVLTGGPARNAVQQAATSLPRLIGQQSLLGGVQGAAENAQDLGSAIKGGATGAAVSGATTGLLGSLMNYGKKLLPGAQAERGIQREIARGPDPNAIRQQSRDLYKVLDQGGIAYDVGQSTQLSDDIMNELVHGKGGWDPKGAHSVLGGVVERITDMRGKPLSLSTLQQIREQAGASAAANEPSVRNAAGRILSAIDGYVQHVDPAQSALPAGQEVGPLWKEARRLWKTANTIDDINWTVGKAERRAASTNSGQNEENAIRQNIRGVVDKATQPRRFNPYSPDDIAQMNRVVEGTPAQNAWRRVGNFTAGMPAGTITGGLGALGAGLGLGGQMDAATALLAPVAGLGTAAATQFAGHAMKQRAADIAQNEADKLVRLIATGSLAELPLAQRAGPPTRAELARVLGKQSLLSGIGRFAGGQ